MDTSYPKYPSKPSNEKIAGHAFKLLHISSAMQDDLDTCDTGYQVLFLNNNAEENNPNQFALKLFRTMWDAVAAFERQKLAADAGLAPPVGSLLMFTSRRTPKWGYETCVATKLTDDECDNEYKWKTTDRWDRESKGPHRLRRALRKLQICGLVINDLEQKLVDRRCPVRASKKSPFCLGGDLHTDNVRRWMNKTVCIDFGYHCVLSGRFGKIQSIAFRD